MTSHILGIFPALIVILVHSERSYITANDYNLSTIYLSTAPPDQPESGDAINLRVRSWKHTQTHERETAAGPIYDIQEHELHGTRNSRSSALDGS